MFSPQKQLRLVQGTWTGCQIAILGHIQNSAKQGPTYLVKFLSCPWFEQRVGLDDF